MVYAVHSPLPETDMDILLLTEFFQWCCIINGSLLLLWSGSLIFAADLVYRIQSAFISLPRQQFQTLLYSFIGLFKLLFILFNLTPYLSLLIISS